MADDTREDARDDDSLLFPSFIDRKLAFDNELFKKFTASSTISLATLFSDFPAVLELRFLRRTAGLHLEFELPSKALPEGIIVDGVDLLLLDCDELLLCDLI